MAKPRTSDFLLVLKGLSAVARAAATTTEHELKEAWSSSSYRSLLSNVNLNSLDPQRVINQLPEVAGRTAAVAEGLRQFATHAVNRQGRLKPQELAPTDENASFVTSQVLKNSQQEFSNNLKQDVNLEPNVVSSSKTELADNFDLASNGKLESSVTRTLEDKFNESNKISNEEPCITPAGVNQIKEDTTNIASRLEISEEVEGTSTVVPNAATIPSTKPETQKNLRPSEPCITPAGVNQVDISSEDVPPQSPIPQSSDSNLGPITTTQPLQQLKSTAADTAEDITLKGTVRTNEEETSQEAVVGAETAAPKPVARKKRPTISENAKEQKVPSSRIGRLASYGSLVAGLGVGAIAEVTRRSLGFKEKGKKDQDTGLLSSNPFLSEANAERIVNTLCKVRGAALKLGQMISLQDNSMINPQLQKIFERVRQSADFMPAWQMEQVLVSELGPDWRSKLDQFDEKPFAAASIGEVHWAKLHSGMDVAMKIQYPGVAEGIESDINNLMGIMKVWNILPEGLYMDSLIKVAKRELGWEVDYVREAECTKKFKELLKDYPSYKVPEVIDELSTKQVLTIEFVDGIPIDKCFEMDQETRNHIARHILQLCMLELFQFRFMQTDPNWANFFYNPQTKQIVLLDFGASREFPREFVDKYLQIIEGAADMNRDKVLKYSQELGFLTGYESKVMEEAHVEAVMILGEAFQYDTPFDFGQQDTTKRIQRLIPVMLSERLCPPPEESYSLHRKMSGAFLLCAKLGAKINCKPFFDNIRKQYHQNNGTSSS